MFFTSMKRIAILILVLSGQMLLAQPAITWSENVAQEPAVAGVAFSNWFSKSLDSLWENKWSKLKVVDSISIRFGISQNSAITLMEAGTSYSAMIQGDVIAIFEALKIDPYTNVLSALDDTLFCQIETLSHPGTLTGEVYPLNEVDLPPQIGDIDYSKQSSATAQQNFEVVLQRITGAFQLPELFAKRRQEGSFLFNLYFDDKGELAFIEPVFASGFKSLNDFAFLQTAQLAATQGAIRKKRGVNMHCTVEFNLFYFDEGLVDFDKDMLLKFAEKGDCWNARSKYMKLKKMNIHLERSTLNALRNCYLEENWIADAKELTQEIARETAALNGSTVHVVLIKPKEEGGVEVGEIRGYAIDDERSNLPLFMECALMPVDVNRKDCTERVYAEYMEKNLKLPDEFRKLKKNGNVLCRIRVDKSGYVQSVEIVKSDHESLNQAAIAFFKGLPQIMPYTNNGLAIEKKLLMNLQYSAE